MPDYTSGQDMRRMIAGWEDDTPPPPAWSKSTPADSPGGEAVAEEPVKHVEVVGVPGLDDGDEVVTPVAPEPEAPPIVLPAGRYKTGDATTLVCLRDPACTWVLQFTSQYAKSMGLLCPDFTDVVYRDGMVLLVVQMAEVEAVFRAAPFYSAVSAINRTTGAEMPDVLAQFREFVRERDPNLKALDVVGSKLSGAQRPQFAAAMQMGHAFMPSGQLLDTVKTTLVAVATKTLAEATGAMASPTVEDAKAVAAIMSFTADGDASKLQLIDTPAIEQAFVGTLTAVISATKDKMQTVASKEGQN